MAKLILTLYKSYSSYLTQNTKRVNYEVNFANGYRENLLFVLRISSNSVRDKYYYQRPLEG
jgi:hypothetical protein